MANMIAALRADDDTEASSALDGFLPEFMKERLYREAAMAAATKIHYVKSAAEAYADMVARMLFPDDTI